MRGLFVTGTDTGAGKSVVAAAAIAALTTRVARVAAFKPVITGLDDEPGEWPPDDALLASLASCGQSREDVAPVRFGPPVSPHYAAELAGTTIEPSELAAAARRAGEGTDALVCEGVGGLLVPLTLGYLVRDFARDLGFPLVVAARPGLGTISHTLLTLEAARAVGLDVRAVVLTPWPARPEGIERSNRETIERLGSVPVAELEATCPGRLREASRTLSVDDWLGAAGGG